ncbi:MAG: hypothetical protein K2X64_09865 [Rhodocyclaceae bacterium]|nr:hypothetical protein [Rhodocyclaceae bacterium]
MSLPRNRTVKMMLVLLGLYGLACLPATVWDNYLDSPIGILVVVPYLSVYVFHAIGIPGLLQNNGACGWGWCAPTVFGWVFIATVWLLVLWGVARVIAAILAPPSEGES